VDVDPDVDVRPQGLAHGRYTLTGHARDIVVGPCVSCRIGAATSSRRVAVRLDQPPRAVGDLGRLAASRALVDADLLPAFAAEKHVDREAGGLPRDVQRACSIPLSAAFTTSPPGKRVKLYIVAQRCSMLRAPGRPASA